MSHDATNWAISQRGLKPATKIVLWHLCDRYHPDHGCFPSQKSLAHECEMSRASLNRHLDELEAKGLIWRERRQRDDGTYRQESTLYHFDFERDPVSQIATRDDAKAVSQKSQKPCLKNRKSRVSNCDSNLVIEPVIEPVRDSSSLRSDESQPVLGLDLENEKKPQTPRQHLESVLDGEHADAVIDHRKRLKKPLTAHAAKLLAGKLAKCPDPNAAADTMIVKGWQIIEPDWIDKPKGRFADSAKPKNGFSQYGIGPDWDFQLARYREGIWHDHWGPKPGEPGYQGPKLSTTTSNKGA